MLINPRIEFIFRRYHLQFRSILAGVEIKYTQCTSSTYFLHLATVPQYICVYTFSCLLTPQYVPTVSYVAPLNFSISSPPPFFCVALPPSRKFYVKH
jgi:hypothetical protein